jgi:hypothetical protein
MKSRRLSLLLVAALVPALAGCGSGGSEHSPDINGLPLVPGARIVAQQHKCDPGANAFCGWELVVEAASYKDSDQLLLSEDRRLKAAGWTGAGANIGGERGADSPNHVLHVTYGTAATDLRGIDFGQIHRLRQITLTLSHAMLDQAPTLSILLEEGSG